MMQVLGICNTIEKGNFCFTQLLGQKKITYVIEIINAKDEQYIVKYLKKKYHFQISFSMLKMLFLTYVTMILC